MRNEDQDGGLMKTKSRATLTVGTARDLADHGVGYVASGEGEYSRQSARPDQVRMNSYVPPPRWKPGQQHPNAKDIGFHEVAIETMQRRLTVEKDPKRIAKLKRDIEAKTKFVAKLRSQEHD
jgi:hypothetical protein